MQSEDGFNAIVCTYPHCRREVGVGAGHQYVDYDGKPQRVCVGCWTKVNAEVSHDAKGTQTDAGMEEETAAGMEETGGIAALGSRRGAKEGGRRAKKDTGLAALLDDVQGRLFDA